MDSSDLAGDVAQTVFTDLARKASLLASQLAEGSSLLGWLYRSTRFASLNQLRRDRRRLTHEREAMQHLLDSSDTMPDWERIRPVLDEAMASLNDDDRDAVLLRFFKQQDLREVGKVLGISDAAAQKRVSRAVERLREFFTKSGNHHRRGWTRRRASPLTPCKQPLPGSPPQSQPPPCLLDQRSRRLPPPQP